MPLPLQKLTLTAALCLAGMAMGQSQKGPLSIPEVPKEITAEVAALFPDASKCGLYDFTSVAQVEASFAAQQRIQAIGELADWALLRIYETHPDPDMRRAVLRISTLNDKLAPHGLALTRSVVRRSIADPGNLDLFRDAQDAADYIWYWGDATDLKLLNELASARRTANASDEGIASLPISSLERRLWLNLPPGQTDPQVQGNNYLPFHKRGLKPEGIESLKRLVAFRQKRR